MAEQFPFTPDPLTYPHLEAVSSWINIRARRTMAEATSAQQWYEGTFRTAVKTLELGVIMTQIDPILAGVLRNELRALWEATEWTPSDTGKSSQEDHRQLWVQLVNRMGQLARAIATGDPNPPPITE